MRPYTVVLGGLMIVLL